MDFFSKVPPEGFIFLGISVVVALFADFFIVKFGLDFLKPASAYVFAIGRAGKVVPFLGWLLYVVNGWYPQYFGQDHPLPSVVNIGLWTIIAVVIVLAVITLPRPPETAVKGATHV